jgi:hypothetical protein
MSDINFLEKSNFEKLFQMASGYVLDFSDRTFTEFFIDFKVDINDEKYCDEGASKARRLRSFWKKEQNELVGKSLISMVNYAKTLGSSDPDLILQCLKAAERLAGKQPENEFKNEQQFLDISFKIDLTKLSLDVGLLEVTEYRLKEIEKCIKAQASLSVILLCGSTLEGVILNHASKNPSVFNKAQSSPKHSEGKTKQFSEWSLNDLINTAHECGFIKRDVKEYSHSLRKFRNYIHPYQQAVEQFRPDQHTATISFQVLKAAIADLSGLRT